MITAKSDIGKLKSLMPKIRKKIMYAESEALNQTANIAARAQRAQAEKVFDRPTPYLLNGIFRPGGRMGFVGVFSRWNTLRAELIPGGPRGQFGVPGRRINDVVRLQAKGGTRTPQKRALPVPTLKMRKNKFGNLSRTAVRNLLAKEDHVQLGVRDGVAPGIYRRYKDGRLVMLVAWEPVTRYRSIYPYQRIADGVFSNNFTKQFTKAFESEMARLRR